MERKRLFLVGIPETHIEKAIMRAKQLGFDVLLGDTEASLKKYEHLIREADQKIVLDYTNDENLFSVVKEIHDKEPLDALFTFKETGLFNVSKLQQAFHLKGNPPSVVQTCLDKYKTRRLLKKAGLNSPNFGLCRSVEDVYDFWTKYKHPIILKPRSQQGSIGVIKVEKREDIEACFKECSKHDEEKSILAEEFIKGKEISIEAVVCHGEVEIFGVTEKQLYPGTFVESGHISPYQYQEKHQDFYKKLIKRVVHAVGIVFGPLHIEGYHTNKGFVVGEVHTRYGGDNIVTITEIAMKCDMQTPIFAELAGIPYKPERKPVPNEVCAVRFLETNQGIVHAIKGLSELKSMENVVDFHVNCSVGDSIGPIKNSYDRAGWMIVKGKNEREVNDALRDAFDKIKIIIR
ncbi:ATP-grasp domain-containing protein [Bacillus swezeyi]|uniref:Arginase n=1 Tax=Bacillus swezeyi TaxID=1925020 RepID=A0A1R1RHW2_9BACI|nr:ATP-grasp domain-containing protein [Bacillus swezeyi]MEC1259831.1 ATP-grasp domain-containing protein [Bacillus swezeyi]MED2930057.1 ATP-grasp domain-containing protein [Bacillus swezeyi]MED2963054.1 ATP-grasp domain-containing protein [Bacillus swezeyi]MED3074262.1 ATP-grasp domain-containing protein [Bacillus swezeyi]MED3083512.1 ATP-grasp domain-containing protein [Bacillus swezeyi]